VHGENMKDTDWVTTENFLEALETRLQEKWNV